MRSPAKCVTSALGNERLDTLLNPYTITPKPSTLLKKPDPNSLV